MKKISLQGSTRWLTAASGMALIAVLFFPIWKIELSAPQYPEGLVLLIFSNRLGGNVDIINGLNHYIGMKTLHNGDFYEFTALPFIIGFFSLSLFLTALLGKKVLLNLVFILFLCFGLFAMIDFWRWEFNYGHHLNPDAAIIVPGMSYQPPLIGFKQLLNFGAYSIPDTGGWLFIGTGIVLFLLTVSEARIRIKPIQKPKKSMAVVSFLVMMSFPSCTSGPESIRPGQDHCDFCKMAVSDSRIGMEIVTGKGKVFKFDDANCLRSFLHSGVLTKQTGYQVYFIDFSPPHSFIPAAKALLLKSDSLRSPMNGNIAAFGNADSLKTGIDRYAGTRISWEQFIKP